jgi:hypothetical protein
MLADANHQSAHIIVNLHPRSPPGQAHARRWMAASTRATEFVGGQKRALQLWNRKRTLTEFTNFLLSSIGGKNTVTVQNAASVGLDYKDGVLPGVEQDRVGCFMTYPIQVAQFSPKFARRLSEHAG